MNNTQKFTDLEMSSIQSIQQKYQEKLVQFGQLNISRISIESSIKELNAVEIRLKEEFLELQKEEQSLISELSSKYGNGQLNLKDGTFTPSNK
jgi:hypothetical protein